MMLPRWWMRTRVGRWLATRWPWLAVRWRVEMQRALVSHEEAQVRMSAIECACAVEARIFRDGEKADQGARHPCPFCRQPARSRRAGPRDAYCGSCDWWFSSKRGRRLPDEPDEQDSPQALARFRNWVRVAIGLDPIPRGAP